MVRASASILLSALFLLVCSQPAAAAAYFGPTPYLSFADSPFNGVPFNWFFLEDFEDGALDTLGVSANAGVVLSPGALTDSVDSDDGGIDGSGTGGHSWYSNFGSTSFTFTFSSAALGGFPTHAGIVWTDVGLATAGPTGVDSFSFEAFDENGASLGAIGPFVLGDGLVSGGTAEDRFFGVSNPSGISAITIRSASSGDWEVDHLQYGDVTVAPEPATALLLLIGSAFVSRRIRRPART